MSRLAKRLLLLALLLFASFAFAQTYITVGSNPSAVAIGDLNGDHNLDIVVLNSGSNNVSVLLGNGSGKFTVAGQFGIGTSGSAIALADANGDGKLDILVADDAGGTDLLLGNGAGAFTAPTRISTNHFLAIADLNGDGHPDLITQDVGNVVIQLGDGKGGFGTPHSYLFETPDPIRGVNVGAIHVIDLNGDNRPDLVISGNAGYTSFVSILLSDGSGAFPTNDVYPWTGPTVVADFNNDGHPDILAGTSLYLGDGKGRFTFSRQFMTASGTTAADVNADGNQDLLSANGVFPGTGLPGFADLVSPFPAAYSTVAAADFERNGLLDLVAIDSMGSTIAILMNPNLGGPNFKASVLPSVTATPDMILSGQQTTLHSDVRSDAGIPNVGTVDFFDTLSGFRTSSIAGTNGSVTLDQTFNSIGVYQMAVAYSGGTDTEHHVSYLPITTTTVAQVVVNSTPVPTSTVLSAPGTATAGASLQLSATVTANGQRPNSGTVQFMDAGKPLGAPISVSQSGDAQLTTTLTAGTHPLTAAYSGGASAYASSTSKTVSVNVSAADFAVASRESSATIAAGQSATFHLTITPSGTFSSAISFSCSGLPTGAACNFTPSSVTPNGSATTTQLTITTRNATSAALHSPNHVGTNHLRLAQLSLLSLAALAFLRIPRRRVTQLLAICTLAVISTNCGGGRSTTLTSNPPTPSGTSQITIVANSGTVTRSTIVTLIVQ